MVFTDAKFFLFFAIAMAVHWSLKTNAARKGWLLGCSVAFYAAWDWRFLGLVFVVILNTYVVTCLLAVVDQRWRRRILVAGLTLSLGLLGVFKYYGFFIDSLSALIPLSSSSRDIVLPIGISFYTFHSLSYMIDTYRRNILPTTDPGDVALYILFFPQLVAGPIVRATDLLPQLREARSFADVNVRYFLLLFLIGYFKKAVVSDNIAPFVDAFYAKPSAYGAGDAVIATVFYSIQIYCDFSGYTDMAIAAAGLLGYHLKLNFAHPYLSRNLVEFWRRWHISLSLFLRDYLYIPLGGNRGGWLFQSRNVLITMILGGLWHGASWTFVVWGALHGIGLVVCRAWQQVRGPTPANAVSAGLATIVTFVFLTVVWIFFRAPDFTTAGEVLRRFMVAAPTILLPWEIALVAVASLALGHIALLRVDIERITGRISAGRFALGYGAAVALVLPFVNAGVQPFIYFQF